ncbi:hypothetical protein [Paludibaculum fermentans]|uniref:hypothetical protein n=1 Tax=Paludibaculum fermentans TaxID=1473598 RepID=UPI003EB82174
MQPPPERTAPLVAVKLLHTAVWLFFVLCIFAIPVAGALREFIWAAALAALVLIECAVLVANHGRCPSTDWAARYTGARTDNFDIYLPLWLARYNKQIFGPVFLAGSLYALLQWWRARP